MSYNPVRAKNWNKRSNRRRQPLNPHAGTKHSDIVRRAGMGATVPLENRQQTASGFMASVMENDDFSVRQEMIGAGASIGFGLNPTGHRLIRVLSGLIFITEEVKGARVLKKIQAGGSFRAPAGVAHGYSTTGTADAEILIVESPGYHAGWEELEAGVISSNRPQVFVKPAAADLNRPSRRPKEESKAKEQAIRVSRRRVRRQPRRGRQAAVAPRGPSPSGAAQVGRNASKNANSGAVAGVNPQPMGAGAYKE
jgi:quercetin dioxygenase-like cupin family protein